MSISKIAITGQVLRNPEKRFTENNVTISSFTVNFGEANEEKIIRVLTFGKLADQIAETVKKGQKVIIEGRLQTNSTKTDSGVDKKFFEIIAQNVEIFDKSSESASLPSDEKDEKEDEFSLSEEIYSDDLIGEDEIPF